MITKARVVLTCGGMAAALAVGCASGSSRLNLNTDSALRETTPVLAKAATTRAYPSTQASQPLPVRAEIDYQLNVINFVNLGDQDLRDLVVWVNGKYSAPIGVLPAKQQRGVNFRLMFDNKGLRAPNKGTWVEKVELWYDGALYTVTTRAAD